MVANQLKENTFATIGMSAALVKLGSICERINFQTLHYVLSVVREGTCLELD